jgi:hypothetical protein
MPQSKKRLENHAFALLDRRFGLLTEANIVPSLESARECGWAGLPVAAVTIEVMETSQGSRPTFEPSLARTYISVKGWWETLSKRERARKKRAEAAGYTAPSKEPGLFPDGLPPSEMCDRLNQTTYGRMLLCLQIVLLLIACEEDLAARPIPMPGLCDTALDDADRMLEEAKNKAAELGIQAYSPLRRRNQIGEITVFVLPTGILSFHWREPGGEIPYPPAGMISSGSRAVLEKAIMNHLDEPDQNGRTPQG